MEDAFSLGLEKLQQSLVDNILIDPLVEGNFRLQMAAAMDNAEALTSFVNQVSVAYILEFVFVII